MDVEGRTGINKGLGEKNNGAGGIKRKMQRKEVRRERDSKEVGGDDRLVT